MSTITVILGAWLGVNVVAVIIGVYLRARRRTSPVPFVITLDGKTFYWVSDHWEDCDGNRAVFHRREQ